MDSTLLYESKRKGSTPLQATMKHDKWIGREVMYTSASGREYIAVVHSIPENPDHGYTNLPTVKLSFENLDRPGKFIIKDRVAPRSSHSRQHWQPLKGGKQLWEKKEDGSFNFYD